MIQDASILRAALRRVAHALPEVADEPRNWRDLTVPQHMELARYRNSIRRWSPRTAATTWPKLRRTCCWRCNAASANARAERQPACPARTKSLPLTLPQRYIRWLVRRAASSGYTARPNIFRHGELWLLVYRSQTIGEFKNMSADLQGTYNDAKGFWQNANWPALVQLCHPDIIMTHVDDTKPPIRGTTELQQYLNTKGNQDRSKFNETTAVLLQQGVNGSVRGYADFYDTSTTAVPTPIRYQFLFLREGGNWLLINSSGSPR